MKKIFRIFFAVILVLVVLGIVFCVIDSLRVKDDQEPIFTFNHKIVDYDKYSAKVDIGLGYKIIHFSGVNDLEIVKVGHLFLPEKLSEKEILEITEESKQKTEIIIPNESLSGESGETQSSGDSGEKIVKITTFGEKYVDTISLEGMDEEVYAQNINSKVGYSMEYYYELFEYIGFEDHDNYVWHIDLGSGDKPIMTVTNISGEENYKTVVEAIEKDKELEQISGDEIPSTQKIYHKTFKENEIEKICYTYLIELDDKKLMVEMKYPLEAAEGIGVYMDKMVNSITSVKKEE